MHGLRIRLLARGLKPVGHRGARPPRSMYHPHGSHPTPDVYSGRSAMTLGQGAYRYEVVEGWEQLPFGWSHGDVAGGATDSEGRVVRFKRRGHPLIVYERDGRFLGSWGEG